MLLLRKYFLTCVLSLYFIPSSFLITLYTCLVQKVFKFITSVVTCTYRFVVLLHWLLCSLCLRSESKSNFLFILNWKTSDSLFPFWWHFYYLLYTLVFIYRSLFLLLFGRFSQFCSQMIQCLNKLYLFFFLHTISINSVLHI